MFRLILAILVASPVLTLSPSGPAVNVLTDDRLAPPLLPPPKVEARRGHMGRVIEVTHNSITVQCLDILSGSAKLFAEGRGWRLETGNPIVLHKWRGTTQMVDPIAQGVAAFYHRGDILLLDTDGNVSAFRRDAMPPTKMRVSQTLASGGFATDKGESRSYRLEDVQAGDFVDIEAESIGGEWRAVAITIIGRPGGRIPPSQLAGRMEKPYHIGANQRQDWLEKGIPIPKDPIVEEARRQLRLRKATAQTPDTIPNAKD